MPGSEHYALERERRMKKLFYILLFLTTVYISGLDLNVHDIISLKIPDSIEIISVDQSLKKHSSSDQFCPQW